MIRISLVNNHSHELFDKCVSFYGDSFEYQETNKLPSSVSKFQAKKILQEIKTTSVGSSKKYRVVIEIFDPTESDVSFLDTVTP